ncbi:pilus assembly protein CpaD [Paracoccus sp. SSJ]|uniref:flavin-dependent monooxygenase QhpG n=1 Tax=Paracoccus sp. SSJ TaxID=3050636 RepID=UPI00254F7144|nr:pilus assembly protein CpaD [Paracoccus sp. SSJ]MDK8874910.1 pilus assembly protein CpaD [Paracoccus sp. SSJ]
MTRHADLIVLGGGPAGAVSAWLAAREGLGVLLVDPDRQRPRIEGLSPRLHRWLAQQGLLRGFAHIHGPLRRQVDWAGISDSNAEHVVLRGALDAHLRQAAVAAGAVPVVASGRPEAGGAVLSDGRRLHAPLVIDARGRNAQATAGRASATVALSGWVRAALPPGIRLTAFARGWLWRVALPDGRAWAQATLDAAGEGDPQARLLAALVEAEPALCAAPAGPVLAREAAPRLPAPVADLALLRVGDAFAAMDPLSGHGQFWAVSSALAVAAVRRTLAARPGSGPLCRRFLIRRAWETSLHQMRVGRDFLRAETRFRDAPFWSARRDFPDDHPLIAPTAPRIEPAILVEDGLLAERELLCTPRSPGGIGWFGAIPAPEVWRLWQRGGEAALQARWGGAAPALARRLLSEIAPWPVSAA